MMLFGIDNFTGESAILVEAPLSVIMLDQYGISNAIASFGCRLSKEQAKYIRSNYNKLLIWYDPDDAGFKGTMAAIKLLKDFLDVYVIKPTKDDPAAMSYDEVHEALKQVYPAWLYETMYGGA